MVILHDTHAKVKAARKPRPFAKGLDRPSRPTAEDLAYWAQASNANARDYTVEGEAAPPVGMDLDTMAGEAAFVASFDGWYAR